MKHNKMIIAAVAACIVLSSATIGAQSWKRSLGKLKQGVEQVTRPSKPNTTRQSGDVQVPEWHEERAQKRTSGLPAAVDTVIEHLRYRLYPNDRNAVFMGVDDFLFQETETVEILSHVKYGSVRCAVTRRPGRSQGRDRTYARNSDHTKGNRSVCVCLYAESEVGSDSVERAHHQARSVCRLHQPEFHHHRAGRQTH